MKKILFTGCGGQIGSELTLAFRKLYGNENVIASDLSAKVNQELQESGPFVQLDVLDTQALASTVDKYKIDGIVHLAAILSAIGENNPQLAWNVNMNGAHNIFELAREKNIKRVLVPSSIAVFGSDTPKNAPQDTVLHPSTMYGVTKVATELLGNYYNQKYGMDIRGLRYPGVISHKTLPGGGTTDYAVAIYFAAVKNAYYNCFLKEDTILPMIYMPDCIKATVDLFHADKDKLRNSAGYNVGSFSVTPKDIAESIRKIIPNFGINYNTDFRQAIADSWPDFIDDKEARAEWNWTPQFDLDSMTEDIIKAIRSKI